MLPLKDDIRGRTVPFVTAVVIGLNLLVFLYQTSLAHGPEPHGPRAAEALIAEFGVIPCRLAGSCAGSGELPPTALTIFTSMFLHGGFLHVGGNMLYLWIFGNNVEDTLGHGRFAVFYLASGVGAAVTQAVASPGSGVPMIGASGAVSGVLGAYLLLFPYARILTLLVFGFFVRLVYVPAIIVLGFWIVVQFINSFASLGAGTSGAGETGGIAWFAHVGGFLAGIALLFLLRPRHGRRP